jgi:hypothetical protein
MIATWKELIGQPLSAREGAVILLAAIEARGGVVWLGDDGRMRYDFTPCGSRVRPNEYLEGLRLVRDEMTQLLRERGLREVIQRSWPPLSPALH